tara:strand:+ start:389 stop:805 length:417 start_codon:yes stop_codon:yes gene_type:complete
MSDNHRIDAYGETIESTERDLTKKRKDLNSKLHRANVSTSVQVVSSHYKGVFNLKGKCKADACETRFEIESDQSWEALQAKAEKHEGHSTHYETQFSVEQYLKLTNEQNEALSPTTRRTPAGPYEQRASSLDKLGNLF